LADPPADGFHPRFRAPGSLNLTLDEAFVDRLAATLTALIDAGLSARSARDS